MHKISLANQFPLQGLQNNSIICKPPFLSGCFHVYRHIIRTSTFASGGRVVSGFGAAGRGGAASSDGS
jgi:hypothetical protein